jgi:hypothetical protein
LKVLPKSSNYFLKIRLKRPHILTGYPEIMKIILKFLVFSKDILEIKNNKYCPQKYIYFFCLQNYLDNKYIFIFIV